MVLIPESGISPEEGNGNPFQHSCLGNLLGYSPWGCNELDMTEQLTHTFESHREVVSREGMSAVQVSKGSTWMLGYKQSRGGGGQKLGYQLADLCFWMKHRHLRLRNPKLNFPQTCSSSHALQFSEGQLNRPRTGMGTRNPWPLQPLPLISNWLQTLFFPAYEYFIHSFVHYFTRLPDIYWNLRFRPIRAGKLRCDHCPLGALGLLWEINNTNKSKPILSWLPLLRTIKKINLFQERRKIWEKLR